MVVASMKTAQVLHATSGCEVVQAFSHEILGGRFGH